MRGFLVALMVACACASNSPGEFASSAINGCLQSPGASAETCEGMAEEQAPEAGLIEQSPEAAIKFIQLKESLTDRTDPQEGNEEEEEEEKWEKEEEEEEEELQNTKAFAGIQRAGQCFAWVSPMPEPLPDIFSERIGNSPWYGLKDGKCNTALLNSATSTSNVGCSYAPVPEGMKCSCPEGCDDAQGGCTFAPPVPVVGGDVWTWPQYGPMGSMCDESDGYNSTSKEQCARDAVTAGYKYSMYDTENSKCGLCPYGNCIAMTDMGSWAMYGPAPEEKCYTGCSKLDKNGKSRKERRCKSKKCRDCDFCKA